MSDAGGTSHVAALGDWLGKVGLTLERSDDGGWVVAHQGERHPLAALPLDDVDGAAQQAELLAVAAGFDAAIKFPAEVKDGESFLEGAPSLLPKVERRRFVDAYHAVVAGRAGGAGEQLVWRELGADLVLCFVQDEGWRMTYVTDAVRAAWDVSPGTVDSAARSHVYARAELYDDETRVALGDHYDAARVSILGDRFFHRHERDGLLCAVPGRDLLLIGPESATAAAVREAYAAATYPLCPYVLREKHGRVTRIETA